MKTEARRIYLSPPEASGLEVEFLRRAVESGWLAPVGPELDAFEDEFARLVGTRGAVALQSGTAGLHLALHVAGVESGDEVVVSDLTFVAGVSPILYLGARPVFVDSERTSWNMDPGLLEELLTRKAKRGKPPKAVVAVHLYGQSADLLPILDLCRRYDLPLVEDAAEALGATYDGRPVGSFGRFGAFSFNGNKIITTSGGGMLVSDNPDLVEHARKLASQARDPAPHYEHSEIGYNYRMSNLLAAVGRAQLQVLDDRVRRRREIFDHYRRALGDLPGVEFMPEAPWGRSTRWLTVLTVDPHAAGFTREDLRLALEAENIEARPVWKPMHLQPVFQDCETIGGAVSEELFERGLCLPSGSAMTENDLRRVVDAVRSRFLTRGR